jgi:hypothetical protein
LRDGYFGAAPLMHYRPFRSLVDLCAASLYLDFEIGHARIMDMGGFKTEVDKDGWRH